GRRLAEPSPARRGDDPRVGAQDAPLRGRPRRLALWRRRRRNRRPRAAPRLRRSRRADPPRDEPRRADALQRQARAARHAAARARDFRGEARGGEVAMAKVLEMPKLSPTMEEGVLTTWHKKEGDPVAVDDLLAEVETDKATMEFRAFDKGTLLKLLVEAGATVKLGQPVAILGKEGEDISSLEAEAGGGGGGGAKSASAPKKQEKAEAEEEQEEAPPASSQQKK